MKILFSSQEAEYAQNENSSHHRHREAVQIKTTDGAANAKHGRQPAADHRTDYPEYRSGKIHHHHAPAWLAWR